MTLPLKGQCHQLKATLQDVKKRGQILVKMPIDKYGFTSKSRWYFDFGVIFVKNSPLYLEIVRLIHNTICDEHFLRRSIMVNTHKDNNKIPLRASEGLPVSRKAFADYRIYAQQCEDNISCDHKTPITKTNEFKQIEMQKADKTIEIRRSFLRFFNSRYI